jgi:hypothetical protein
MDNLQVNKKLKLLKLSDNRSSDRTRLLSRSLEDLLDITVRSTGQQPQEPKSPKRILYPVDMASVDETQQEALNSFVSTLQDFLGVQAQTIDIGAIWAESPPDEASDEDMQAYMRHVSIHSRGYHLSNISGTFSVMVL